METRRANMSGRVNAIRKNGACFRPSGGLRLAGAELQRGKSGISGIAVLAVLSVIALVTSILWRSNETIQASNDYSGNASPSSNEMTAEGALAALRADTIPLGPSGVSGTTTAFTDIGAGIVSDLLGSITTLEQAGAYSTQAGQTVAEKMGQTVLPSVQYAAYDDAGVQTDKDVSPARALAYRRDLQTALKPLLLNDEAEYAVFGRYVETGDRSQLVKLQQYASNYRAAASGAAALVVPADARSAHVALLNALEKFAATLDALSTHASDPFASAALLVTYNSAEDGVRASFADLVSYFKQKLL